MDDITRPLAKRKKDEAFYRIRDGLDDLLTLVEDYQQALQAEKAAALAEAEPYMHLVRALDQQLASVEALRALLDDEVWARVIRIGNGSAYVEHGRTRDYF